MFNKVILTGRLTKAIEVKRTPAGKSVASFQLAVERRYKNQAGEKVTDFHDCVIWNALAENLAKWTGKGSLIGVVGRLEKRSYQNQQGQRVTISEVIVEEYTLLDYRQREEAQESLEDAPLPDYTPQEQTSFFQGRTTNIAD
ncbi:single-stranded DNA-binding protein [Streptococcus ruminantium]|nr:single-stranded DNA-binding protein [Streptococcus ruminantium]